MSSTCRTKPIAKRRNPVAILLDQAQAFAWVRQRGRERPEVPQRLGRVAPGGPPTGAREEPQSPEWRGRRSEAPAGLSGRPPGSASRPAWSTRSRWRRGRRSPRRRRSPRSPKPPNRFSRAASGCPGGCGESVAGTLPRRRGASFLVRRFLVSRGIRHDCPASCSVWAMLYEPIARRIRHLASQISALVPRRLRRRRRPRLRRGRVGTAVDRRSLGHGDGGALPHGLDDLALKWFKAAANGVATSTAPRKPRPPHDRRRAQRHELRSAVGRRHGEVSEWRALAANCAVRAKMAKAYAANVLARCSGIFARVRGNTDATA